MILMFDELSRLNLIVRRLAAVALVLWLAGIGCIVGCEMYVAAAQATDQAAQLEVSSDESCPTASGHGCCKEVDESTPANVRLELVSVVPHKDFPDTSCCQQTSVTSDPARKLSANGKMVSVSGGSMPVESDSRTSTPFPANRVRVPDRGSTHLRCCVFLI